jgi:hypothetical protein
MKYVYADECMSSKLHQAVFRQALAVVYHKLDDLGSVVACKVLAMPSIRAL